jgi:hypothetical protein
LRSGTPSIQQVTPVTSYMTSISQSDLMYSWEHHADLQHKAGCPLLKLNCVLFKYAVQVLSCTVCSGTKCTFQNVKELTTNCSFVVLLMADYFINRGSASTGIYSDSWRNK